VLIEISRFFTHCKNFHFSYTIFSELCCSAVAGFAAAPDQ
jgi:hypothetical protein